MPETPSNPSAPAGGSAAEGYCVKCKSKRPMKDVQTVQMKNGREALQGKCAVCGTGMYKILSQKK